MLNARPKFFVSSSYDFFSKIVPVLTVEQQRDSAVCECLMLMKLNTCVRSGVLVVCLRDVQFPH